MVAAVMSATAVLGFGAQSVFADEVPDDGTVIRRTTIIESTSPAPSTNVVEPGSESGVAVTKMFAPKYKERLNNYADQIQMGLTKGWLTSAQADHFNSEVQRLRKVEADCAAQNYAKPALDDLEKQMTQFNIDLSRASSISFPAKETPAKGGTGGTQLDQMPPTAPPVVRSGAPLPAPGSGPVPAPPIGRAPVFVPGITPVLVVPTRIPSTLIDETSTMHDHEETLHEHEETSTPAHAPSPAHGSSAHDDESHHDSHADDHHDSHADDHHDSHVDDHHESASHGHGDDEHHESASPAHTDEDHHESAPSAEMQGGDGGGGE
jgi:hypothetical protein